MQRRSLKNWLDGFMFYTRESECPDSYLKWAGLHTLSATLQRRVYVDWVYHKFYPNIYILLLGPPGVTHKNAAIRFSRNPLRAIDIVLSSEAITKEGLIQQMITRALHTAGDGLPEVINSMAVMPSEFATFIRSSGDPMVEFLTDIFDSDDDWEYTTKGSGTSAIPAPYLTMFTGATPGWFANEFDRTFIEGGFASRVLIVHEVEPRFRRAFARITDEMLDCYRDLITDLEYIRDNIQGEFTWTPKAISWFEHWYEESLPLQEVDYRIASYHGRKSTHLLKVAQLVCINSGDCTRPEHLRLTPTIFEEALSLLNEIEPGMARAYRSLGDNPYSTDLERIAADIIESGGLDSSEIYAMNIHQIPKMELDQILETLLDMEVVKVMFTGGGKKRYVPS